MSNKSKWHGIMILDFLEVLDKDSNIVYRDENRPNILHTEGEQYILQLMFNGITPPDNYYFGLNNNTNLTQNDTMASIVGEPIANQQTGYGRAAVISSGGPQGFSVPINYQGNMRSQSPLLVYNCNSVPWGPVQNIFMTTKGDNVYGGALLISSAKLSLPLSMVPSQTVRMKFSMQLSNC